MSCQHNKHSLVLAEGRLEWCYWCGAVRPVDQLVKGAGPIPKGPWALPTGKGGEDPSDQYRRCKERWKNKN